jgi:hypothetical protein
MDSGSGGKESEPERDAAFKLGGYPLFTGRKGRGPEGGNEPVKIVRGKYHKSRGGVQNRRTSPILELGIEFWVHLVTFGIGPLLALLTTLFLELTSFVVSFVQPGMQAFK